MTASHQGKTGIDPFGATANPALYVPRPACEGALEALVRCLRDEGRSAVLHGPPGLGKTLLLRVVARRLGAELRVAHLPYAALPAGALCTWALEAWGESPGYDPVGAIVTLALQARTRGGGVVLLVDDAQALPDPALLELGRALSEAEGALRIGAACDEGAADRLLAVWPDAERIAFEHAMGPAETASYVLGYLRAAGLSDETYSVDVLAGIHASSGGVPSCVNAEASRVLRVAEAARPKRTPISAPAPEPSVEPTPVPAPIQDPEAVPVPAPIQDPEAALLRAAGRLAIAHGDVPGARDGEPSEAFERAVGRLVLARAEPGEPSSLEETHEQAAREGSRGWLGAAILFAGLGVAAATWWLVESGVVPLP